MILSPSWRKLALTGHVIASVGWLGAVIAYLGLSIVAVTSEDATTVRAVHLAMDAGGWSVLVPLSMASLLSGLVQSLGTRWGVLLHYWVVVKLCINVVASIVLVLYTETLGVLADDARSPSTGTAHGLGGLSPLIHSAGALVLLIVATVLSIYKPPGLTRHGRRRARRHTEVRPSQPAR